MSLPNRKVKGYIFKSNKYCASGQYYEDFMYGTTILKEHAHVYSMEEIKERWCIGWADKHVGKWIVVYEEIL